MHLIDDGVVLDRQKISSEINLPRPYFSANNAKLSGNRNKPMLLIDAYTIVRLVARHSRLFRGHCHISNAQIVS